MAYASTSAAGCGAVPPGKWPPPCWPSNSWRNWSGPGSWFSSGRPARHTAPDRRPALAAFAELGAKSNFSLLDGASHPEELAQTAQALGLAGLGICDLNSLAGVV